MMNIITSLHVYYSHLIISYLGKGVDIIPFEDLHKRFKRTIKKYHQRLELNKTLSEIETYGHQLFGVIDSTVNSFTLFQPETTNKKLVYPDIITSQLSLDFSYSDLYLLSEDEGIYEVSIHYPNTPKEIKKIIPETFEKIGDPSIANMISKNRYILLAYRGFGASLIKNFSDKPPTETVYRSEDAQDAKYFEKQDLIIVADGIEGLVLYQSKEANVIRKIKLPDQDFPQELKLFNRNILIKGKNGLYIYYLNDNKLKEIWSGSIGAFTTYYNYIFFSSNGKVNLLVETAHELSHFKLLEKDRLDIIINKY